jgi:hypothetical protein
MSNPNRKRRNYARKGNISFKVIITRKCIKIVLDKGRWEVGGSITCKCIEQRTFYNEERHNT